MEEECEGMSVEEIEAYYGVYGKPTYRMEGQSGAGHLTDEEEVIPVLDAGSSDSDNTNDWVDVNDADNETTQNIQHDAIPAPEHSNPFTTQQLDAFNQVLQHYTTTDFNPAGYKVLDSEWSDDHPYPVIGIIPCGRRQEIRISLPESIWCPRAQQWARALFIMNHILNQAGRSM